MIIIYLILYFENFQWHLLQLWCGPATIKLIYSSISTIFNKLKMSYWDFIYIPLIKWYIDR